MARGFAAAVLVGALGLGASVVAAQEARAGGDVGLILSAETEEGEALRALVESHLLGRLTALDVQARAVLLPTVLPRSGEPFPEEWIEKAWLAYKYFNFDEAERNLLRAEAAAARLERPEADRRALFDVKVFQGMLALVRQDRERAARLMLRAAELGTVAWLDPLRFPPGVTELFNVATERLQQAPVRSTHVLTEPPGAQVIVDGRTAGATPLTLPLYLHHDYALRLEREDTRPHVQVLSVPLPDDTLKVYLGPRTAEEIISVGLAKFYAEPALGAQWVSRVREQLGVRRLYLGRVARSGTGWLLASVYFSEAGGLVVGRGIALVVAEGGDAFAAANPGIEEIVHRLAQADARFGPGFWSFTRKPWFWGVVIGVAAAGGAAPFVADALKEETVTVRVVK
ncbi:MAG: PEGA domain-containing protein [Nitrospirae bacterium]|nr:PEGA domain-containing protein [Nitrospirota bacterium]